METDPIKRKDKLGRDVLFKSSRFKEVIKKTSPHKHEGYFELVFLYQGAGFHWVDMEKLPVEPPILFLLSPGQLHHWELTKTPKGFVILFRDEFFDYVKQKDVFRLVRQLGGVFSFPINKEQNFEVLFQEIDKEYLKGAPYSKEIIQGLLQVIFSKLMQVYATSKQALGGNLLIYNQFRSIIQQGGASGKLKVKQVAEKLHMSPQNLNALCRKVTGNSAGSLLKEQVLLEAKRYLLHTDLSVSQIAYQLSFSDPSHFVKFFRKSEGITPALFRAAHFQ